MKFPEINLNEVKGLCNDSRKLKPGDLFIAYQGGSFDGRQYLQQAIKNGAQAIAYESENFPNTITLPEKVPCFPIANLSAKLGELAAHFYNNPSHYLNVCGITGTNGKTTIAYHLAQAYENLGKSSAYIGTLGQGQLNNLQEVVNTTPDGLLIQRLLADYKSIDIKNVFMEVSSHALSQNRVGGVEFNQAIYTNLTHDHLDYHHTMQNYANAKARLFASEYLQCAIINGDDKYSTVMIDNLPTRCKLFTYGFAHDNLIQAVEYRACVDGTYIDIKSPWGKLSINTKSLGQFNVYNSLAVLTSLLAAEIGTNKEIINVMSTLHACPGRMEIVSSNPCVVVDYAHTPDALENVLQTLQSLKPKALWVVFGCGGDRDVNKRPLMGSIADKYATYAIVTNDNPRTEDPSAIAQDIDAGMGCERRVILDRREAIHYALANASPYDIVLIAGKGHEDYQINGLNKIYFSDKEVVREFIKP